MQHKPATCTCSLEIQLYSGLYQMKCGQNSFPLACSHETLPEVVTEILHVVLGPLEQKRDGPVGLSPKNDQGTRTPLL